MREKALFASYAIIGFIATSVHYAVLFALVEQARFSPASAAIMGSAIGALVSYAANRQFTFIERSHAHQTALPRFLLVAGLGLTMSGVIVWAGTSMFGLHYLLAQAAATLATVLATYELNRSWSFA